MRLLFCFFFSLICFTAVRADIGETYDLLNKREHILKENEQLLNGRSIDSLNKAENARYVENLNIIKLLDEEIFKSQQQTVDRVSGTSGKDQYVNKSIALLSFLLAFVLAVCLYMLYLMNNKLNRFASEEVTFSGRMKELFSALLVNFQPVQNGKNVAVHRLILLGLLFMFVSFLGFLLKTLGV